MIGRLGDGECFRLPVDLWVDYLQPWEPKDNIFLPTRHDVEGYVVSDSCYVEEKAAGIFNWFLFILGEVGVSNADRRR